MKNGLLFAPLQRPRLTLAPTMVNASFYRRDAMLDTVDKCSLPLPAAVPGAGIQWIYAMPIIFLHLAALLVFLPWFFSWTGVAIFAMGVVVFGQVGIPLCYHRQLTHKSFQTPKWVEHLFVLMALFSMQETPARWVAWHRKHHAESDHQEDPHSPLVNFFWSHVGWLWRKNPPLEGFAFVEKYARDVLRDPFYFYLERRQYRLFLIYISHALVFFLLAWAVAVAVMGNTAAALRMALSVFVWGVVARTVFVWHVTWSVNSLSHMFGYRTFDTDDDSRNNWFVALITGGEGWHNNHHHDQASAQVGLRWWEYDSTFWIIRLLEFTGLATNVILPANQRRNRIDAASG